MLTKRNLFVFQGTFIATLLLCCCLFISASMAKQPAFTAWSHVGSACSVDETSQNKYDSHVHVFKFKGDSTGSIYGRCNIAGLKKVGGDALYLQVTYTDSDGPGNDYQVRALLRSVNSKDGSNSLVTEFDSNDFSANPNAQRNDVRIDHNFDFDNNAYYVEFRLSRNKTAHNPAAAIVRIVGIVE